MKLTITLLLIALFRFTPGLSQQPVDTAKTLEEVLVRGFEQNRKAALSTANVRILTLGNADRSNKTSLVNGFNTIAGVRMEERSPGSYRINIRGSSLRSPFGVGNVKVYWNEIPVTDPGGNTYFNQFAANNFSSIEIFKGPPGSLYGAGTGGLILLNNMDRWQPGVSLEYMTGSFGLQNVFASANFGKGENKNQLTYAHNSSDGYRVQTAMRRDNFTWTSQLKISDRQQLTASLLFTDMYYQTPGALNAAEFAANPRAARPAGGGFPSAEAINAAIYQKTILAGFNNQYQVTSQLKNSTSLYGAFAQVKNSAIRNYERRNEPQFGGRSSFIYNSKLGQAGLQLVGGGEFQQGYNNTQVSENLNGNPDTLQTNDDVIYTTYSIFAQADLTLADKWLATVGLSLNKSKVGFKRLSVYPVLNQERKYENELAPRFSLLRKFGSDFSLLATVATGFSPPAIRELLPSTGVISTGLNAEKGINYEMTARYHLSRQKLYVEATAFYFRVKDALVQQRDLSGADFFTNAGDVKQKGVELHADYVYSPIGKWIDNIIIQADYTYSHFRYGHYVKDNNDFSGNEVPSVPAHTISAVVDVTFKNGIYINSTFYSASGIFLNDANTFTAKPYEILGGRIGWKTAAGKYRFNVYVGGDNLLNEVYSLGNDINAAANRFYNMAPARNYYGGIAIQRN